MSGKCLREICTFFKRQSSVSTLEDCRHFEGGPGLSHRGANVLFPTEQASSFRWPSWPTADGGGLEHLAGPAGLFPQRPPGKVGSGLFEATSDSPASSARCRPWLRREKNTASCQRRGEQTPTLPGEAQPGQEGAALQGGDSSRDRRVALRPAHPGPRESPPPAV